MSFRLEQSWRDGDRNGCLEFVIVATGTARPDPARLCLCATTMPLVDAAMTGGVISRRFGTYLEIGLDAPVGPRHAIAVEGLTHRPSNRSHGALSAWLEWADGNVAPLECGDLQPPEDRPRRTAAEPAAGKPETPLALLPWPARVETGDFGPAPLLVPAAGADPAPFATVAALHRRLFPNAPAPIALAGTGRAVRVATDTAVARGGYRIVFGPEISLTHADADGRRNGLVVLAQIAHGARTDPHFAFPGRGTIADAPRFDWRGCHLDVARSFHGPATVTRLLDILAWLRMNRFHWHLTDDEGWRLPSRAFPALERTGRVRGGPLPPQYRDGPNGMTAAYSEAEIADVLAHAGALGIRIMPEIDLPGHCSTLLHAVPGLSDPEEPEDSYRSVQGFPNNALNPGLDRSYSVVATLLAEAARLFPDAPLHIGGDEVDAASWNASPAARRLADREGLTSTQELQAHFMRRLRDIVEAHGRLAGAWDEAADGGGVDPSGTLLFAWRSIEKTAELIAKGYDVVATPGQAYYLDMVPRGDWDGAGANWAGVAPPEATYRFEPADGLPDGPGRLVGVQAGIWTEHLDTVARINAAAFPRLAAIAETAWTPKAAKSWPRFAALARLVPQL